MKLNLLSKFKTSISVLIALLFLYEGNFSLVKESDPNTHLDIWKVLLKGFMWMY